MLQERAPWPNLFQYVVKIDPLVGRRRRSRGSQFNSHTSSSLTSDRGDRGRDYRNRERMDLCCGVAEAAETERERGGGGEGANRRRTMQSSRKERYLSIWPAGRGRSRPPSSPLLYPLSPGVGTLEPRLICSSLHRRHRLDQSIK